MGRRGRTSGRHEKAFSRGAAVGFATANRSAQPRTVALGDAINAATTGRALVIDDSTQPMRMVDMVRDGRDMVPFGPSNPLAPAPIDPSRPDTHRPEPRLTEYPVSWNLPGSSEQPVPWATLRAAAESVDVIRRCISVRKEQLQGLDWSITLDDQVVQGAYAASDGSQGATDIEAEMRRKMLPEIERLTKFWKNPWASNGVSFEQWCNGVMEDHLVLDGVAIYPRMTYGGELTAFELIDPTTIKLLIDYRGARPQHPYPAFQQILYGFPRAEFGSCYADEEGTAAEGLMADQLWYFREEYRSFTPYGYSAVQQALISARLYLRRQGWMLAEYDDGSTPLTFLVPDATDGTMVEKLTPRTRQQWEDSINAMYSGNTRQRHRMKVLQPGMQPIQMQGVDERYKPDYDMHLIKMLAGHFGVTSSGLGFSESRGLGNSGLHEGQADVQESATTKPDKRMIERIVNELMCTYQNAPPELKFKFTDPDTEDKAAEDTAANAQRARGTITLNDDRKRLGKSPYTFPEADMALVLVGNAWAPLEGMAERAEQAAEAEQALVDDQLANSEAQRDATTMEAEEVTGEAAEKALELAAYRRWARKRGGDARRPFICKALEPTDFPGLDVPADVDFEQWQWVPDGLADDCTMADIEKAFGDGNDNWRTLARDSRGRWVKRGSMRVDALGPSTPDKPVLAGLRADSERRRAASATPSRQLPVSDASSTMGGMTSLKVTPTQLKALRTMHEAGRGFYRNLAGQKGVHSHSIEPLLKAGLLEAYPNPDPESWKGEMVRPTDAGRRALGIESSASVAPLLGELRLSSAQAMTPEGQRYGAALNEHRSAVERLAHLRSLGRGVTDLPAARERVVRSEAELRAAQAALTDAPLPMDQRRGGYTSEGDRVAAQDRARNTDIDVPASRARFGRKTPKDDAVPSRAERAAKLNEGIASAMAGGPPPAGSMAERIQARQDQSVRDVVTSLQDAPGGWVAMADVRRKLEREHGLDRGQQDIVLRRLATTGDRALNMAPEDNQKTLRDEDHAAAIDLGAGPQHIISLDPPRSDDRVNIGDPASVQRWMDDTGQFLAAAQAAREANPHMDARGRRWIEGADGLWRDGNGAAVPRALLPAKAMPLRGDDDLLDDIEDMGRNVSGGYVSLAQLRAKMGGTRDEQDAALKRLDRARVIILDPDPNRKAIAPEGHEAAISIGGEPKHLVSILNGRSSATRESGERAAAASAVIDSVPGLREGVARQQGVKPGSTQHSVLGTGKTSSAGYLIADRRTGPALERAGLAEQIETPHGRQWVATDAGRAALADADKRLRDELDAKYAPKGADGLTAHQRSTSADDPELTTVREATPTPGFALPTTPPAADGQHERDIAEAYADLEGTTDATGGWVGLAAIRERMSHLSRAEQDAALRKLNRTPGVQVHPLANFKSLTPADRAAAMDLGDEQVHAIRVDARGREALGLPPIAPAVAEHPQKAAYDSLLDGGFVKHKQARQIVEQMEAHGWTLTSQNSMMQTTEWEAPDGRKMAVQFLTSDKPKFYPGGQVLGGNPSYKAALAHVVTPTHEPVGAPSVRTAAERVSPELGQRVRAALSDGGNDDHVRRLDRAQRELVGYGSTPQRPVADVVADLRSQADRTDALAQSNAEHAERMGDTGRNAMVERQRSEAAELRAIADVMDQQATERAAYEAERERRAAAPLDIRPTTRGTAKPTPAKRAEAVAASTPDAPAAAPSINDMMAANMANSLASPSVHGAAHGKVDASGIDKGTRVQFRGTAWTVEEKPRKARPDAQGRTGVVFRATREDQGVTATMRLDDGKTIALAPPK